MKKSLLLSITWITLVALTATTLYAQTTTGNSVISKMKTAVSAFTLAGDLNPGQTGLQSAPVSGKKTGDILTAGEWNRLLELVSEGGSGSWLQISFKKDYSKDGNSSVPTTENIGSHDFCALTRYGEGALSDSTAGYCKVEKETSGSWTVSIQALNNNINCQVTCFTGGGGASGGTSIIEWGLIKTSPKTISNWDLITLEGSWNSGGGDAAPTGGYIYKLNGQPRLSYVEASGISKDTVLTTTAQNVHNLTVKLSGDSVVIDPSSTNTLAYIVWKFNGGSGASSVPSWVNLPLTDTADFDTSCEYRISFPAYGSGSTAKPAVKQYAWAIYAGKIEFGDTGTNDYPLYIPKNDKANFYHPSYGKVTSWGVAPEKIEKRCN